MSRILSRQRPSKRWAEEERRRRLMTTAMLIGAVLTAIGLVVLGS